MRTADDFAEVRRRHRNKLGIRAIALQLGAGRDTAREASANPEPVPYTLATPRPAPTFGAFRTTVDDTLVADPTAPPEPRRTAGPIFRRPVAEHHDAGGDDRVRRYLKPHRRDRRETFVPPEHPPGRRAGADFGHIHVDLPDGRRRAPVPVVTGSDSNCPSAVARPTERTEAVPHGRVEAFTFLGCVPRGRVPGGQGLRHVRLHRAPVGARAEGAGGGARRVGRAAHQLLPDRQRGDRRDAPGDGAGPGRLPAGSARAVRDGGESGGAVGGGAPAAPVGTLC